jgi:NAD(P)-dependent dehydrogenase (short-subunit alcohol dehydrogenase family)
MGGPESSRASAATMKNPNRGKVVAVTGASAEVGRAVVREFARQGAQIGLIARGRERLEATRHEVEELGGNALVLPADVANAQQIEAGAERVERELGPIDIWVNDAMTTVFAPFLEITADEFKRTTAVTYLGQVYGTMAALKRMHPRDRGCIVQVGSALAFRSIPLQSPYCGAKHAIVGFTDSIRSELIHNGSAVHITAVRLPAMNTPQFSWCRTRLPRHPQPVPPIFQPEVAARAIVWAASHKRREVNVGWPTVEAIYAQEIAPSFADHYLAKHCFDGQQTSEPVSPDRPDNLFEPVPGDYSTHGIFDDHAKSFSVQSSMNLKLTDLTTHRGLAGLAGMALTGLLVAALRKRAKCKTN